MISYFHDECQVDEILYLGKTEIKTDGNRRKVYLIAALPFQTPFCGMGLSGIADHSDSNKYCMASNLGCKTNIIMFWLTQIKLIPEDDKKVEEKE